MIAFGTGSTLNVCLDDLKGELQCCAQPDEDALGMRLNNVIRYDVSLGVELRQLQTNTTNFVALSSKYTGIDLMGVPITVKCVDN